MPRQVKWVYSMTSGTSFDYPHAAARLGSTQGDTESAEQLHAELEEEFSDVFVFLFKLAYQTGVDVEAALARGQAKAEARYPDLVEASAELARYQARQAELARMVGVTE